MQPRRAGATLGQAKRWRAGTDLTLVTWSRQMHWAAEAARTLAQQGIAVELIDLRTLWPWDRETVFASAARTGRLLVTHEAVQVAGFGAEIAASAAEATGCRVGAWARRAFRWATRTRWRKRRACVRLPSWPRRWSCWLESPRAAGP